MNFTVEETNLMCIYDTDSRTELIHDLEEMQTHLQGDELELMELTKTTLAKLHDISDDAFKKVQCELVADFE